MTKQKNKISSNLPVMRQADKKIAKLKSRLKELKKKHDELEEEQQQYMRYDEIEYELYSITDEADDIQEEIKRLKKK